MEGGSGGHHLVCGTQWKEDWEAVGRSLDSTEEALQAVVPVCGQRGMDFLWHFGVDFLNCLEESEYGQCLPLCCANA